MYISLYTIQKNNIKYNKSEISVIYPPRQNQKRCLRHKVRSLFFFFLLILSSFLYGFSAISLYSCNFGSPLTRKQFYTMNKLNYLLFAFISSYYASSVYAVTTRVRPTLDEPLRRKSLKMKTETVEVTQT